MASLHFADATPILDWYHLSANVHAAADAVFGEGTGEAQAWAEARLEELWNGSHRAARRAVAELGLRAAQFDDDFGPLWDAHLFPSTLNPPQTVRRSRSRVSAWQGIC